MEYSFRSALNGFHRGEVLACIEELLRDKNALSERLSSLESENAAMRRELEALRAEPQPESHDLHQDELEAYRRAEAVERRANETAERLLSEAEALKAQAEAEADALRSQAETEAAAAAEKAAALLSDANERAQSVLSGVNVRVTDLRALLASVQESLSGADGYLTEASETLTDDPLH